MAPRHSYLSHLECGKCARLYDADAPRQVCECGSPLLARYDLASLRHALTPSDLAHREPTLWRYHELLPVRDPGAIVTLGEGMTPLVRLPRLGERLGLRSLYMKDEGLLPTGTFKARGAAVGISRALELGIETIAMPTNGNAGAAWAAYAARAGIAMWIVMPKDAPAMTTIECTVTGAHVYHVNGLISDAGRIVARAARARSWFDGSTLKEPYRIEGKKTMGIELAEQLGWRLPDVIVYPTGGGTGMIGMWKAFAELREMGWLDARSSLPRMVSAQADGCAPIVRAFAQHADRARPWENPTTHASGLRVPGPLGDRLILRALYESNGAAGAASESAIRDATARIGRTTGVDAAPEGGCALAVCEALVAAGNIASDAEVVLFNTGGGVGYRD
jgi:threonine synthase